MKAKFKCPRCRHLITVAAEVMGKRGKCPGCAETIQVPTLEQFQAAAQKTTPTAPKPEHEDFWEDLDVARSDPFDEEFSDSGDELSVASAPHPTGGQTAVPGTAGPRPARRSRKEIPLGIGLLVLALFAAFGCWIVAGRMTASKSWPSVKGQILSSEVQMTRFDKKLKVRFRADVRYTFQINGRPYTGTQIRFGDTTGSSMTEVQAIVDKYRVGSQVDVFYNPQDPAICVLEPGGSTVFMVIPPVVLVIGGVYCLLQGMRGRPIKVFLF